MTYLIDTNVISELRKNARANPAVLRWVGSTRAGEHHTSVLVIGELRNGVELKRRRDPLQAGVLEGWLNDVILRYEGRILPVDARIAQQWGKLGVPDPLPAVDGLLAATALVHDLTFVTRNRVDVARTGVRILDPFLA